MARLTLTTEYTDMLAVVIRDQNLDEVWRGILEQEQGIDLPDGHYLMEVTSMAGLERQAFDVQGGATNIVVGDSYTALPIDEFGGVGVGVGDGDDNSDSLVAEQAANFNVTPEFNGTLKPSVTPNIQVGTPSASTIRQSLQRAMAKRTSTSSLEEFILNNPRLRGGSVAKSHQSTSRNVWGADTQSPILIGLWSKVSDARWELNQAPTLEQLLAPSSVQRFMCINGADWPSLLVAMPNWVETMSISNDPRQAAQLILTQPNTNLMALRTMIERHERQQAALLAAKLATAADIRLPEDAQMAAQVSVILATLLNELNSAQRPDLAWFKALAFTPQPLPDPLIAYAWYGLYSGQLSESEAAAALIKSVARGVPYLTMSLQLQLRGFELLAYEGADASVFRARETVRNWADHLHAEAFFTTFMGHDGYLLMNPEHGSLLLHTGHLFGTPIDQLGAKEEGGFFIIEHETQTEIMQFTDF